METSNLKKFPQCPTCGKRLWKWKDKSCRTHMDYSFRKGKATNKGRRWKLHLTEEQLARRREIIASRPRKEPSHCIDCDKPLTNRKSIRCMKCVGKVRRLKVNSPETRAKIRAWHVANAPRLKKDTSIEIAIENLLKEKNVKYEKQYSLHGVARVDFFLPENQVVIQCDGCYWHGCPEHYPQHHQDQRIKDEKKDAILRGNGITVYRIWEHAIKASPINSLSGIL